MHYTDFETRWLKSGGAERANYGLFLQDLCDLLGVPRPDPTTAAPVATAEAQPWPAELAQQMFAVRSIVQQAGGEALSSAQVGVV